MVYCVVMMCAYYLFNWVIAVFWIRGSTANEALMQIHHVLAFVGLVCALFAGCGFVVIAQILALMEFSSIFMNFRTLMMQHELSSKLNIANTLIFFLLFTVFRVALLPVVGSKIPSALRHHNYEIGAIQGLCMFIATVIFGFLFLVNYYWYFLIIKTMAKMLGCTGSHSHKSHDKFQRVDNNKEGRIELT